MGSRRQPDRVVLRAVAALWLSPVLMSAAGCQEPAPPLPPILWSGAHLDYGELGGELPHLCGGTLQYMDEFVGIIKDRAQAKPEARAVYYLAPDGWEREWCTGQALGCADGNVAFGRSVPLEHELVHAVLFDSVGTGDLVLSEGIAEAWGVGVIEDPPFVRDVAQMLRSSSARFDAPDQYPRAGHFVSYLLDEFGTAPVLDVIAQTRRRADAQQLDSAFVSAFGMDMNGIVDAYAEYPECGSKAYSEAVWACTALPSMGTVDASRGLEVEIELTLDCSNDMTIGSDPGALLGESDGPTMWQWAAFEVVETHGFRVMHDPSSSYGTIEVVRCDIGCPGVLEELLQFPAGGAGRGWIDLEPGRYVTRFARSVDSPGEVSMSFL